MPILKLVASGKSYVWGGTKLIEQFGKRTQGGRLAETWELSCHPDGECYIESGYYAGQSLSYYIACNPDAAGSDCAGLDEFPVLIKLIDAREPLSVQVHPEDEYARSHEGQQGKTEMWYIVDCKEGASIYYGLNRELSREELAERIANNTLTEVLKVQPVKKGDCFFIEAGTIHAIGAGIVLAEVQQNSNVTYRVFDFGRIGADGKPRMLHIDKALDVARLVPTEKHCFAPHLAKCSYFTVDKINADGAYKAQADKRSFHSVLVLDGSGTASCGEENVPFVKGSSLVITAGSGDYTLNGRFEALLTTV